MARNARCYDTKNQLTNALASNNSYDDNGNMVNGPSGLSLTHDDENRLVSMYLTSTYRTDFVYDGLGRLRTRQEYGWSSGWIPSTATSYIYDGNRVIQERVGSSPTVSYTRGTDLSGSLEGLARSHGYTSGTWTSHNFYHADGNGNVTYPVDSSQNLAATYRYDSFGNNISQSGTLAGANVYRFSSKRTPSQ